MSDLPFQATPEQAERMQRTAESQRCPWPDWRNDLWALERSMRFRVGGAVCSVWGHKTGGKVFGVAIEGGSDTVGRPVCRCTRCGLAVRFGEEDHWRLRLTLEEVLR